MLSGASLQYQNCSPWASSKKSQKLAFFGQKFGGGTCPAAPPAPGTRLGRRPGAPYHLRRSPGHPLSSTAESQSETRIDQQTANGTGLAAAASTHEPNRAVVQERSRGLAVDLARPASPSATGISSSAVHPAQPQPGKASDAPVLRQAPVLDPSAYELAWDFVTIRGCPDGQTIVYKFGAVDPTPRMTPGSRPRFVTPDGVTWSNALRLWVKKGSSVELTLRKLEQYVQEYGERQSSDCALDHQLYRPYEEVLAVMEVRLENARRWEERMGQSAAAAAAAGEGAAGPARPRLGPGSGLGRRDGSRPAGDGYGSSRDSGSEGESWSGRGRRSRFGRGAGRAGAEAAAGPRAAFPNIAGRGPRLPPLRWYDGSTRQVEQQAQQAQQAQQKGHEQQQQGADGAWLQQAELAAQTPLAPLPLRLNPEAYLMAWNYCTVRGWRDGSLVYKFGTWDPRERLLRPNQPASAKREAVAWSCALRLGIKKAATLAISLRKLDDIMGDYAQQAQRGSSASSPRVLDHPMHLTWEQVATYMLQRWAEEGQLGAEREEEVEDGEELEEGEGEGQGGLQRGERERRRRSPEAMGAPGEADDGTRGAYPDPHAAAPLQRCPAAAPAEPATPAPPTAPSIQLDPGASACWWKYCTIRGWEDGTLLYKFGSVDPPPPYVRSGAFWRSRHGREQQEEQAQRQQAQRQEAQRQQAQRQQAQHQQARQASWAAAAPAADRQQLQLEEGAVALPPPSASPVEAAALIPGSQLLEEQQQQQQEEDQQPERQPFWSNALWLAVKQSSHCRVSYSKLAHFVAEYGVHRGSAAALDVSQHRSYQQARRKLEEWEAQEEIGAGAGAFEAAGLDGAGAAVERPSSDASEDGSGGVMLAGRAMAAGEAGAGLDGGAIPAAGVGAGAREEAELDAACAADASLPQQEQRQPQLEAQEGSREGWGCAGVQQLSAPQPAAAEAGGSSSWLLMRWLVRAAAAIRSCWQRLALAARTMLAAFGGALACLAPVAWLLRRSQAPGPEEQLASFTWPPKVNESHVSPSLATMLKDRAAMNRQALEACGFNVAGKTLSPLADLPARRVSQLTGHPVRQLALYRKALTHLTALPHERRTAQSYERLEWLGDSVLELTVRRLLMEKYPGSDEGELSQLCQTLVSGRRCHEYAVFLGLDKYVVMAGYSMRDGLQQRPDVLADVFEALVGALYQDQGFEAAAGFVLRVIDACMDWSELEAGSDCRQLLSKYAISQRLTLPKYRIVGKDWCPVKRTGVLRQYLTVEVTVGGKVMGSGTHWEKCFAERAAAKQALKYATKQQ